MVAGQTCHSWTQIGYLDLGDTNGSRRRHVPLFTTPHDFFYTTHTTPTSNLSARPHRFFFCLLSSYSSGHTSARWKHTHAFAQFTRFARTPCTLRTLPSPVCATARRAAFCLGCCLRWAGMPLHDVGDGRRCMRAPVLDTVTAKPHARTHVCLFYGSRSWPVLRSTLTIFRFERFFFHQPAALFCYNLHSLSFIRIPGGSDCGRRRAFPPYDSLLQLPCALLWPSAVGRCGGDFIPAIFQFERCLLQRSISPHAPVDFTFCRHFLQLPHPPLPARHHAVQTRVPPPPLHHSTTFAGRSTELPSPSPHLYTFLPASSFRPRDGTADAGYVRRFAACIMDTLLPYMAAQDFQRPLHMTRMYVWADCCR